MDLPIRIYRTYEDGHKEQIVLKPIQLSDAEQVQKVVESNKDIKTYLPSLYKNYTQSSTGAFNTLRAELSGHKKLNGKKTLIGIFVRAEPKGPLNLVGLLGFHSYEYYRPKGYDVFYLVGKNPIKKKDGTHVKVKGVVTLALQAYLNFFIANTDIRYLNIAIRADNTKSIRVAKKMPTAKRLKKNDYRKWGYEEKKNELIIYSIERKKWLEAVWK